MDKEKVTARLRKIAKQLRKQAERERVRTVKLDPKKVRDFMLFYGR